MMGINPRLFETTSGMDHLMNKSSMSDAETFIAAATIRFRYTSVPPIPSEGALTIHENCKRVGITHPFPLLMDPSA